VGYYTRFEIKESSDPDFASHVEDVIGYVPFGDTDEVKWYEHEDDIARVMLAYEVDHVEIHGQGEGDRDEADIWDKVFDREVDGDGEAIVSMMEFKYELRVPEEPTRVREFR